MNQLPGHTFSHSDERNFPGKKIESNYKLNCRWIAAGIFRVQTN